MRRTATRILKPATLVLAVAAIAAPAASAQPIDTGPINAPSTPRTEAPAPVVRTVESSGFDWGDATIGAGGVVGLLLLAAGGTFVVSHRRTPHAS